MGCGRSRVDHTVGAWTYLDVAAVQHGGKIEAQLDRLVRHLAHFLAIQATRGGGHGGGRGTDGAHQAGPDACSCGVGSGGGGRSSGGGGGGTEEGGGRGRAEPFQPVHAVDDEGARELQRERQPVVEQESADPPAHSAERRDNEDDNKETGT
jgi:hypothetical protein